MSHMTWHHGPNEIDLTVTYEIEPGRPQTLHSQAEFPSVEIGDIYYKENNKDFGELFTGEISDAELDSMKEYVLYELC
tara:strand:- start:129 stop:362 length:234 start_codon:yes stop_codon:yes gene_type:complete